MKTTDIRARDFDELTRMNVRYQVSFDTYEFHRQVYTTVDIVKDVGGLAASLISFFKMSVLILNYRRDRLTFARQIYSKRELRDECVRKGEIEEHDEEMKDLERPLSLNMWRVFKINLLWMSENKHRCCFIRKNYEDRLQLRALKKFQKQIEVSNFFQQLLDLKKHLRKKYQTSANSDIKSIDVSDTNTPYFSKNAIRLSSINESL